MQGQQDQMSEFDDLIRKEALRTVRPEEQQFAPTPVTGLVDSFTAGVRSTGKQLGADVEYFKAITNTLLGDSESAARNIEQARVEEDLAAAPVQTIESFSQFVDEPTVGGFFTQIAKGTGQLFPYAVSSIVSAGVGGVSAAVGKGILTSTNRSVAKRLLQDTVEKVARNEADLDELELAENAYKLFRQQQKKETRRAITTGALVGAGASEFVPLSGSNLSEALESGQELDRGTALRAAGIALPQAAIGVGGEALVAKSLFNVAKKRSIGEDSFLSRFASDIGKSALRSSTVESGTELVQEGIAVANRFSLDDDYTIEEAQMRLAEAAFMGFFGGGSLGAAGGALASGVSQVQNNEFAQNLTKEIFDKANDLKEKGRDVIVSRAIEAEQYGDMYAGITTPESQKDINAQLEAMTDRSIGGSQKNAVWVAGKNPTQGATRDGQIQNTVINGFATYTAFVPGKGTIISPYKNLVEAVIRDNASDRSLKEALGYSSVKSQVTGEDLVVQVFDKDNNVVSEEVTTQENLENAMEAGRRLAPKNGRVETATLTQTLEARNKRRLDEEVADDPNLDLEEEDRRRYSAEDEQYFNELVEQTNDTELALGIVERRRLTRIYGEEEAARILYERDYPDSFSDEIPEGFQEEFNPDLTEQDIQEEVLRTFSSRNQGPLFPGEQELRDQYEALFGPTDFENGEARFYTQSLLRNAVDLKNFDPDAQIEIRNADGDFQLVRISPSSEQLFTFQDRSLPPEQQVVRVPLAQFLRLAVRKAKKGKFAKNSRVTITSPDGKTSRVNLVDLNRSGQRVAEASTGRFEGTDPFNTALQGFSDIMAELLIAGYDVSFNGESITDVASLANLNIPAAIIDGNELTIAQLIKAQREGGASLYLRDNQGNIVRDKNGKPRINPELPEVRGFGLRPEEQTQGNLVLQVVDRNGVIVSEKVTTEASLERNRNQLRQSVPSGGRIITARRREPITPPREEQAGLGSETEVMSENLIPERDEDGNIIRDEDGDIVYRPARRIDQETTDTPNLTRGPTTPTVGTVTLSEPETIKANENQNVGRDSSVTFEEMEQNLTVLGGNASWIWDYWNSYRRSVQPNNVARGRRRKLSATPVTEYNTVRFDSNGNIVKDSDGKTIVDTQPIYDDDTLDTSDTDAQIIELHRQLNELTNDGKKPFSELTTQEINEFTRLYDTIDTLEYGVNPPTPPDPQDSAAEKFIAVKRAQEAGLALVDGQLELPMDYGLKDAKVVAYIKDLLSFLKLKNPPIVLSSEIIQNLEAAGILDDVFKKVLGAEVIQDSGVIDATKNFIDPNTSALGRAIRLKDGRTLILIRPTQNTLGLGLTSAHEIGHAFVNEFKDTLLENSEIRDRLFRAFQNDPSYDLLMQQYQDESKAFNEFFADQIAKRATKRFINRKPKNIVDRAFKDFIREMRKFWRQASARYQERWGTPLNQTFETFIDTVVESRKNTDRIKPDYWVEKRFIKKLNQQTQQKGGTELERTVSAVKQIADRILNGEEIKPVYNLLFSADSYLRRIASSAIADIFYVRAQQGKSQRESGATVLGMVPEIGRARQRLESLFLDTVGDPTDPAIVEAIQEAENEAFTYDQLSDQAKAVRDFYKKVFNDYIAPSNTKIGQRDNYTPVILDLEAIASDPNAFLELVLRESGQLDNKQARNDVKKAIIEMIEQMDNVQNLAEQSVWEPNPQAARQRGRKLTAQVNAKALRDAGFLRKPDETVTEYINSVTKRVEWNRHTKNEKGQDILGPELEKLSPKNREKAREIIETYLGYQKSPMNPFWRNVNSWAQVIQFYTILPFVTLASFTELAGPMIASKDFVGLTSGLKEIINSIKNYKEAEIFARDIGVIASETVATVFLTESERQFLSPAARKTSDFFFKYTGLNVFTKFTRIFATNMGINFIIRHADPATMNDRSLRYLDELGLKPDEVKAWLASGRDMSTDVGVKVRDGLTRFVESSILRPNAAERPMWASDPRFALIWQLKSFFWAYGKVILAGGAREARTRLKEGDTAAAAYSSTAGFLALAALTTLPLTMLGLELREYAKNGLAWLLPGVEASDKYFRTDRMDWSEYMAEIVDRSGVYGPFTILNMMQQSSEWGRSPISPLLGPTAETLETIARNGFNIGKTLEQRLIPIYNQL